MIERTTAVKRPNIELLGDLDLTRSRLFHRHWALNEGRTFPCKWAGGP